MYGSFKKFQILFEIVIYSFFSLENKPWGSNSSALGVKIECCLGSKLSASTQSQCLCGCMKFWPLVHSILTPGSTVFWPPAALDFDRQGLFSKLKSAINHNFKRELDYLKKAIHLIIFLRFYGKKKLFF